MQSRGLDRRDHRGAKVLATVEQLKTRLGMGDANDDALLAGILAGVSARIAREAGRVWRGQPCLELTAFAAANPLILNVPMRQTEWLWLPAWPVVAVTDVRESPDQDWTDADALDEGDDYNVDYVLGGLSRGYWMTGAQTVRVLYSGGYVPAGATPTAGQDALPSDLTEAAIEQATAVYNRRSHIGLTNASGGGGSVGFAVAGVPLMDGVREIVNTYRRLL